MKARGTCFGIARALVSRAAGALLLCLLTAGCASYSSRSAEDIPDDALPGGKLILREDIQRVGARNAWEAIERSSTHLTISGARGGDDGRISYRGVDSLVRERDVLVIIDGNAVRNGEAELRAIRAESILFIQVLSGREAALRWGSDAGNGVIFVRTSAR